MTRVLVFSEPDLRSIYKTTLGILDKLSEYETEIATIGNITSEKIELIQKHNVSRINVLKGHSIEKYSPEGYTHALHNFIEKNDFDIIIAGATSIVQDIFPRLSVLLDTALASSVVDFFFQNKSLLATKELFGGRFLTDIELLGAKPWLLTIKPGVLNETTKRDIHRCAVVDVEIANSKNHTQIYSTPYNSSTRPPLEIADIVVAGGRGLKKASNLKILEKLADILGAALGASGGAVGNDFAPQEYLIGQTGTEISPLLYISCGISGAIQHIAGIRGAKYILAINTDVNAPLMRMADYAIIGDLEDVVPAMIKALTTENDD